MLCDLAELLAERGDEVEIFTDEWPGYGAPEFSNTRISVTVPWRRAARRRPVAQMPTWSRARPRWRSLLARYRGVRLVATMVRTDVSVTVKSAWYVAHSLLIRASLRKPFDVVIGVDPEGLRQAWLLSRLSSADVVYYSLELMLSDEVSSAAERRLKESERRLSRRARCIVIQDRERARLLAIDNLIATDKFVFAPNAPLGPARRSALKVWHERFALPQQTRVLLHMGSLGRWTGIEEIVKASDDLPDGWVLVVHTRFDPSTRHDRAELEALRGRALSGKVYFSTKPVPRLELPMLVDSADAGVAFYVPTRERNHYQQKNIEFIGLSSGKVSGYLRAGLPVIVNSASTLGELVQRERLGVRVRSALDLPDAVREVEGSYELYSAKATDYFDRELDFRLGAARIIECLDSLR